MNKKVISVLVLMLMLFSSFTCVFAEKAEEKATSKDVIIQSTVFNKEDGSVEVVLENTSDKDVSIVELAFISEAEDVQLVGSDFYPGQEVLEQDIEIPAKSSAKFRILAVNGMDIVKEIPVISLTVVYTNENINGIVVKDDVTILEYKDIVHQYPETAVQGGKADENKKIGKADAIKNFLKQTGFSMTEWKQVLMIFIACVLLYLAIVKGFEPLLLLPIAFGMLLTNLAGAEMFHEELFAGGHVHWDMFGGKGDIAPGLIDYLYLGVKLGIYPCLIFVGVGAMTDFGPLIANPKSLLLGAAAQVGIFATYLGAIALGFLPKEAASIGIIGGADGPTAIFVTTKLAPHLLGPIAVAAYSYMALVPVIQPPIMKLLTTKAERQIEMKALREVSKTEKIIFPIVVSVFVALLVPSAGALVGCLMLGNLLKESGVCERLSKTVQNELMNIVTVFLGISVGATATASTFLSLETIKIIVMGVVAFGVATAAGVLLAKFMNLFLKNKINPLIGSAGVSAVPMAARVSQVVGQKENPSNFLLMHAMGPNVAGVIGSAIAAGALIALLG